MEKKLEDRIRELGEIVSKKTYIKRTRRERYCPGGGDGHSFNDAVEYEDIPVYGHKYDHSMLDRIRARAELKRIRKKAIETGNYDGDVKYLLRQNLKYSQIRKEFEDDPVGTIKKQAIACVGSALFAGAGLATIGYLLLKVKGCIENYP